MEYPRGFVLMYHNFGISLWYGIITISYDIGYSEGLGECLVCLESIIGCVNKGQHVLNQVHQGGQSLLVLKTGK